MLRLIPTNSDRFLSMMIDNFCQEANLHTKGEMLTPRQRKTDNVIHERIYLHIRGLSGCLSFSIEEYSFLEDIYNV